MINKTSFIISCISVFGITACGGGGSSSNASNFEPLQITGENATEIVSAVFSNEAEDFTDFDVFGSADNSPSVSSLSTKSLKASSNISFDPVAETINDTTANCLITGTVRVSGEIANTDDVSVGDRLEFDFKNCSNDSGITLNGAMGFVYREYEVRDFFDEVVALDVSFDNLTTVTNSESIRLDGNIYTKVDSNADRTEVIIRSDYIESRINGQAIVWRNYRVDTTTDSSSLESVGIIAGRLESDSLGGYVDVETTSDLVSEDGALPREGSMLITGSGNSSIMLTVLEENLVELSIDEDGDGVEDENIETSWQGLEVRL